MKIIFYDSSTTDIEAYIAHLGREYKLLSNNYRDWQKKEENFPSTSVELQVFSSFS